MRILFVADGRSPIAQQWIRYWVERGDEVYLASTFPVEFPYRLAGFCFLPVAFSSLKKSREITRRGLWGAHALPLRFWLRQWLGPLTVFRAAALLQEWWQTVRPAFVHALRIPYEGMVAALSRPEMPLLVSVWGNDFTLHARSSPLLAILTRLTLRRAEALQTDCRRDLRLAAQWGFDPHRPTLVVPGNGGIDMRLFFPPASPPEQPIVLNPRGFRKYVRNDTFFRSIPLVLERKPEARFLCAAMAGEREAEAWIQRLGIAHAVELLPPRPHPAMADLYRRAQVLVSPSVHDGTPNSVLEGMACGCFPIVGDLESLREWITDGVNGLLVDATNPPDLAEAIVRALSDPALREQASRQNAMLLAERAEYQHTMLRVLAWYESVLEQH
ncbi:MAG: glycosyltransferase family 4 protein [Anaerolineales bacterium]|nr:glycosyltransferase family 4 protein [Anaerolineales bacterium]MCX7609316.1 glycosyltransferase family 4 protein [Anaerolineales bacterium]MDW8226387.1 glycosyltransferase family 4 protein [Anaerolineales bacterium]